MRTITRSLLLLLIAASPALAQPERGPRKYVPFDIDPKSFDDRLRKLQLEKQLGSLKDLVKQIAADPGKIKLDPELLKDLKLDDPQMKRLIKDWANSDPDMKRALQDWIKQQPTDKQSGTGELQKSLKAILDEPKIRPTTVRDPPTPRPTDRPKPKEDPLAKMTERAMKNAENSQIGDWLRDSPAWRDALADLQQSMKNPNASEWGLAEWNKKLGLPNEKAWQVGEDWLDKLREMPRPKMDGWKVDFTMPKFEGVQPPNFDAPALPNVSTPSLPSLSLGMSWFLFLIVFVLVGWQMYRWTRRSSAAEEGRASLGPWPIRPEAVSTRTELVLAFDYLALLTLGLAVKSWNHRAIAQRWSERSECGTVAAALAQLYELARYTDGADRLSESQRDDARRSLLQLAEAF